MPALNNPPPVVIDTNVVLDWLLFDHPLGRQLGDMVANGTLAWIATSAMQDEFFHVLSRDALVGWNPDAAASKARWTMHCRLQPAPAPSLATPRCTDPDDQKFIDLAAVHPGALLLSRDRAVLKLAPRLARDHKVRAWTPERWAGELPSATPASKRP